jgi:hypothetical protein
LAGGSPAPVTSGIESLPRPIEVQGEVAPPPQTVVPQAPDLAAAPPEPAPAEVAADGPAEPSTKEAETSAASAVEHPWLDGQPPAVPAPALIRLAVIGVSNESSEREFSKLLIAQGISQLVAQALFDTGRYVPVEDNPEITGRINELVVLAATSGEASVDYSRIDGQALGCDAMASAVVKKFSKSRMRGFAGPFSAANVDVEIEVEVAVREAGKPVMTASGNGTGTTKSRGVLFQVRENKVHFDQTSVGQATQEAVQQAVTRLVAKGREGG